ncbi:MAG: efflux RND transporter periplasmic adaptor subunit [Anaerolineales bacterium]|nr:efflux RND transporter periplasmic adaptor subunit [Anaerolineales bacterium]
MNRKRLIVIISILVLLVVGLLAARLIGQRQMTTFFNELETVILQRGSLISYIEADGVVRSAQSSVLRWDISAEVREVVVAVGDQVEKGQTLASLGKNTLPASVILAQVDLIDAQQELDDLHNSRLLQAEAQKAVEDAQQALEDAYNPAMTQAQAQAAIANAERDLERAQRHYDILMTPASAWSLQQINSNILLTEKNLIDLEEDVAETEKKVNQTVLHPFESRIFYKQLYSNLQIQLAETQKRYVTLVDRYNELQAPPDPSDVAVAEAALFAARAQLADAHRQWQRVKDGPTQAEIAVLEAKLEDAQREWDRLKDGPTTDDITSVEARIAASQALLAKAVINSPFDGVITEANINPGDQIDTGDIAFRLDDLAHLFVDLQVSEIDINSVDVGQDVILTYDAVLAKEYHGRVVAISPVGTETGGVVSFEVTIELMDADEAIRPGMTATVDIEISRIENTLLVPNQAIRALEGQRVVYAFGDGIISGGPAALSEERPSGPFGGLAQAFGAGASPSMILPIPITVGVTSDNYSEVLSGDLAEGDEILLNPIAELLNSPLGQRGPTRNR